MKFNMFAAFQHPTNTPAPTPTHPDPHTRTRTRTQPSPLTPTHSHTHTHAQLDVVIPSPCSTASVVTDVDSLSLLRGSTIDYEQTMIRSAFAVKDNPQSEAACGCGSSFALKNFEGIEKH